MLKINLLPIRHLKKRAKARNQIMAAAVVFISVLILLGLVGLIQANRISTLEDDIAAKTTEKKSFDKVVSELAALEQKRIDLNNKINIINKLKTDSSLAVHVLDQVSNRVDNSRMWLTSLNLQGNTVNISGYALDNETIAQFMVALDDSKKSENEISGLLDAIDESKSGNPENQKPTNEKVLNSAFITFNSVNLSNSSLAQVSGKDLKSFSLTCSVVATVPAKEEKTADATQQKTSS